MGKDVFRTGDLVQYGTVYYINGNKIYYVCKIMEIQSDNKSWDRLEVVTGRGDENTKVRFLLKVLGSRVGWEKWKKLDIETVPNRLIWCDNAHDVHIIDLNDYEREYQKAVSEMDRIMDLIRSNSKEYQRSEKLKELGI